MAPPQEDDDVSMSSISNQSSAPLAEVSSKSLSEYSLAVKRLKVKYRNAEQNKQRLQNKLSSLKEARGDIVTARKIGKFCKERNLTPEMLFRFTDIKNTGQISKLQFRQTMKKIGIGLDQTELIRLEYLLDEDLSGTIDLNQYTEYLAAFSLRRERGVLLPKDPSKDPSQNKNNDKKNKRNEPTDIDDSNNNITPQPLPNEPLPRLQPLNYVSYEQFLKHCRNNYPSLSTKQIAALFNRLQINGRAPIDKHILDKEIKLIIDEENRIKNKNNQDPSSKPLPKSLPIISVIRLLLETVEQTTTDKQKGDNSSAAAKRATMVFTANSFTQLERKTSQKRGSLFKMFTQMDVKKRGTVTHLDIIRYYLSRKDTTDPLFGFEILGHKYRTSNDPTAIKLKSLIPSETQDLKEPEITKITEAQMGLVPEQTRILLKAMALPISVRKLMALLKLQHQQPPRPLRIPEGTFRKESFFKGSTTIFREPYSALRMCLMIEEQLKTQTNLGWHDYEFGPTQADPNGLDFIHLPIQTDAVKWTRLAALAISQFYDVVRTGHSYGAQQISNSPKQMSSQSFAACLQNLVVSGLLQMSAKNAADPSVTQIEPHLMVRVFEGLSPIAFQQFRKVGVYVFKLYQKDQWLYILVDDRLPCSQSGKPLFAVQLSRRDAWISLAEKAYAKLKGSYAAARMSSYERCCYELTRAVPVIRSDSDTQLAAEALWGFITTKRQKAGLFVVTPPKCAVPGLTGGSWIQVKAVHELMDARSMNYHRSHRLLLLNRAEGDQEEWNPSWNQIDQGNKTQTLKLVLQQAFSKVGFALTSTLTLANFKLARNNFESFGLVNAFSPATVFLRKLITFEPDCECRYQLINPNPNTTLTITMNLLRVQTKKEDIEIKMDIDSHSTTLKNPEIIAKQLTVVHGKSCKIFLYSPKTVQYSLSLYLSSSNYEIVELDSHLPFLKYTLGQEERSRYKAELCNGRERDYLIRLFFRNVGRTVGTGCCG